MTARLNGFPAMGNPVRKKQVLKSLKAPLPAIPNSDGTDAGDTAAVNAILAAMRTLGLIAP